MRGSLETTRTSGWRSHFHFFTIIPSTHEPSLNAEDWSCCLNDSKTVSNQNAKVENVKMQIRWASEQKKVRRIFSSGFAHLMYTAVCGVRHLYSLLLCGNRIFGSGSVSPRCLWQWWHRCFYPSIWWCQQWLAISSELHKFTGVNSCVTAPVKPMFFPYSYVVCFSFPNWNYVERYVETYHLVDKPFFVPHEYRRRKDTTCYPSNL
jgi:hypothetical protein